MARNLLILLCLLFITAVAQLSYQDGYNRAKAECYGEFYSGTEGYCLADKPPHPGECHG